MNRPDDVPTSLTRRAYALRGVTVSQNQYAAVVADAYEDIRREVLREAAEKIRQNWRGRLSAFIDRTSVGSARFWARGAEGAADLIDPDKED